MRCQYCGCTEDRACRVKTLDQPPSIRQLIAAQSLEAGVRMPLVTGCAWVQHDPPVCSAPKCVEAFAADQDAAPSPRP